MNRKTLLAVLCSLFIIPGCSLHDRGRPPSTTVETVCNREADLHLEKGQWDEAIALHQRIIRENPDLALAHYHLGYAYSFKGVHDREIEEYETAKQLGLKKFDLFYNLGMAYAEYLADYDKALAVFKQAESMDPKNAEIHYAIGLVHWFKGTESEAVPEFLKAIHLDPHHLEAHVLLGEIYSRRGQYDFAKAEWEIVLELDPGNEMARRKLKEIRDRHSR